ncbi:radical SAM protein [Fusobacterium varium]
MIDKIGREIEYLRLSITDRCNLRCQYCMSERNMNFLPKEELLTVEEIKRIVKIFSKIGIKKNSSHWRRTFSKKKFYGDT